MLWFNRKEIKNTNGVYLRRWHIIPRNPWVNIYLHHFLGDDDSRALHDHPWHSWSLPISGGYWDILPRDHCIRRKPWRIVHRRASKPHRVRLVRDREGNPKHAWTIFLTGPRMREWRFHCPQGWRPWFEFVDPDDHGRIGPGCD